jgi:hypothetical protein
MTREKGKRNRASTIQQLPPDILEQLHELLRDPRVTQMEATREINELLASLGMEDKQVSKSAVNRYKVSMDQAGAKLQQSRQVAEMWIARLGSQPQGKVGLLVNELLRNIAFELTMKLQDGFVTEENMPGVIESIKHLSLTMQRLEKAAADNVKREADVRKAAAAEAADVAEKALSGQGMSRDSVDLIKREILGIA